jgi:3-keto-disaccharide hydrolase
MFDGVSLQGWKETPFYGHGKARVVDGSIELGKGVLTGITWTGDFPKANFEIRLEAMRVDGRDFFAGITFPVHDSYCSWINGGWGGVIVGLSSLDSLDASENETSISRNFESGRWYALRLRVTDDRIQAWIDSDQVIDVYIANREIDLRPGEIELSKPFGIASYSTTAKLRNIAYREIPVAGAGPRQKD